MTPTSSFPYQSKGAIDFSRLNFVYTEQVEHLDASGSLISVDIKQSYDPAQAFWTISLIVFVAVAITAFFVWFLSKKSKSMVKAFGQVDDI